MIKVEKFRGMMPKVALGGLLTGSALLFVSTTIVNAGNYLSNLVLGRWLGPAAFADFSLMVTFLLILTLATATLQMVAAKFAAAYSADQDMQKFAELRRWFNRWSWTIGLVLTVIFAAGAPLWQEFFHTESILPFIILGVGIPFYLAIFGFTLLLTHFPTLSYGVAFFCFPFVAQLIYHSGELLAFSIGLLIIPTIRYIPRIKEMRATGGSWRHVFMRRNLKDRL